MPELPEVEVVRAGLEPAVTGASVASVTVFDERSLRRHAGPSEDFIDRMLGVRFAEPERRGKFLWLPFVSEIQEFPTQTERPSGVSQGGQGKSPEFPKGTLGRTSLSPEFPREALVVHLGMSGQVLLRDRSTDDRLTRIRLDIVHPTAGALRLNFVDQRIFGSMAINDMVPTSDHPEQVIPAQVAHIARDPLDELFDDALFLRRLAARKTGVKRALLDQTLVSGIGNIYADEALWAARVHYDQPTSTLSRPRAQLLLAEVRAVLVKALGEGGTSFDAQYVNVNGASGYFSHSLNAYGQQGKPCSRCGTLVVREQFMNRGSHFCPKCQRVRVR
jgi:formamidopyrimidine-DNA glycosylase